MYRNLVTLLLILSCIGIITAQPTNIDCANAIMLCAGQSIDDDNTGAMDDPGYCGSSSRMLWYTFLTNSQGGPVTLSLQGIDCPIISGMDNELSIVILGSDGSCIPSSFIAVSTCASGNSMASVTSTSLPPATQFWVILAGIANNGATIAAECGFTIFISGPGVDVNGIDLDAGPDVAITQGGSTQLQGLAPNYNWSPPDGLSATNIADPIAAPVSTTLYTLTCYIGDCSYADQVLITVNDPISIAETDARSDITLFPIPGTDSFIALLPPGEHTITLFDASGRVALLQRTVGERSSVHTTHLPSGIYAVRLDDRFQVLRWVKE